MSRSVDTGRTACRDAVVRRSPPASPSGAPEVGEPGDRGGRLAPAGGPASGISRRDGAGSGGAGSGGAGSGGAGSGGAGFDGPLTGRRSTLLRDDGVEVDLDPARWRRRAHGEDRWLLDRCHGPAIDLGCGPGRLVAALTARGLPALGVDLSTVAQRLCRRHRAPMVRRDVFGPLPDEGTWQHVLLADGNIGIGGDPLRLLHRAVRLLGPGGTVLVETEAVPDAMWCGTVRVRTGAGVGAPLPWACAGADALGRLAATLGLRCTARHRGARTFVQFTAPGFMTSGTVVA